MFKIVKIGETKMTARRKKTAVCLLSMTLSCLSLLNPAFLYASASVIFNNIKPYYYPDEQQTKNSFIPQVYGRYNNDGAWVYKKLSEDNINVLNTSSFLSIVFDNNENLLKDNTKGYLDIRKYYYYMLNEGLHNGLKSIHKGALQFYYPKDQLNYTCKDIGIGVYQGSQQDQDFVEIFSNLAYPGNVTDSKGIIYIVCNQAYRDDVAHGFNEYHYFSIAAKSGSPSIFDVNEVSDFKEITTDIVGHLIANAFNRSTIKEKKAALPAQEPFIDDNFIIYPPDKNHSYINVDQSRIFNDSHIELEDYDVDMDNLKLVSVASNLNDTGDPVQLRTPSKSVTKTVTNTTSTTKSWSILIGASKSGKPIKELMKIVRSGEVIITALKNDSNLKGDASVKVDFTYSQAYDETHSNTISTAIELPAQWLNVPKQCQANIEESYTSRRLKEGSLIHFASPLNEQKIPAQDIACKLTDDGDCLQYGGQIDVSRIASGDPSKYLIPFEGQTYVGAYAKLYGARTSFDYSTTSVFISDLGHPEDECPNMPESGTPERNLMEKSISDATRNIEENSKVNMKQTMCYMDENNSEVCKEL